MLFFSNDYCEGAHPKILEKLSEINFEKNGGYGDDAHSLKAKELIKQSLNCPQAEVYFLVGGTQTNVVVIDTMLDNYQGVISANTGHINAHEAGAVEFTGRKVLPIEHSLGKISAEKVDEYCSTFYGDGNHEHMVFPGMVYISHPTEYGTLYTKDELAALHAVCQKYEMPLFMDGARLGYGLASKESDLSIADIAELTDVFYIGGTKVGALFGEAVVFTKNNCPKHFVNQIKRHGALLAKGFVAGVQFETLFTDNLYFKIAENAITQAEKLRSALKEKGYRFFIETSTNQIFVIVDNKKLEELSTKVVYSFWEKYDENNTVIRFATSWATKEEDVDKLIEIL